MSTKTTFKRIALVAVAALGFGMLSVVPSSAVPQADTLTASTLAPTAVPGAAAATTITQTYLSTGTSDTVTATVSIVSMPTGNTTLPVLASVTTNDAGSPVKDISGLVASSGSVANGTFVKANYTLTLTTEYAGTYVVRVTPQTGSAASALTITYSITDADAAKAASATGSRVYMRSGAATTTNGNQVAQSLLLDGGNNAQTPKKDASYTNANLRTNLGTHIATQDASTSNVATLAFAGGVATASNAVANFGVILSNNETVTASTLIAAQQCGDETNVLCPGGAYTPSTRYFNAAGHPVTMTVTGPGWVRYANTIKGKTYTEASTDGSVNYIQKTFELVSDGNTGISTVTFSADGVTLKTFTVNFYGTAAKITPTLVTPVAVVGSNVGAITAIVTDASGVPVSGATVRVVSATAAAISNSYTSCTAVSTATGSVSCDLTGVAAGTSSITLTTNSASTVTTGVTSDAVSVRVGTATVATYTLTSDKAEYTPGELATITLAMKDANGLPVATSAVVAGAMTSSHALSTNGFTNGGSPTAGTSTGLVTFKVNMPVVSVSELVLTFTPTSTALAAATVKIAVLGGQAADAATAATDAALEEIDAAQAATEAANDAAQAADTATAAAQDAADAVAALSVSVAAMIDSLKKQITALTNLVIKIQKKVRA
jgi:hypothetical protein